VLAPIHMPIELSAAGSDETSPRVWRLAHLVGLEQVVLGGDVGDEPEWLAGPLRLRFHLPGDPLPITTHATAHEVVVDRDTDHERAERRALFFDDLPAEAASRLERYVEERLTTS
jgi:hypothetical protein